MPDFAQPHDDPPTSNVIGAPVPRVVHQIWLQGPDRMRPEAEALAVQCMRVAKAAGWEYRMWADADLLAFPEYAEHRDRVRRFAHLSDLGRYAILWHLGGLYLDVDIEMQTMPPPLVGAWIQQGNNAAMAAPPGHPYIARLIASIPQADIWDGASSPYNPHSPVNMCMLLKQGQVTEWPPEAWQGYHRRKTYGNHLSRFRAWGSQVDLGDTFPPGSTR